MGEIEIDTLHTMVVELSLVDYQPLTTILDFSLALCEEKTYLRSFYHFWNENISSNAFLW